VRLLTALASLNNGHIFNLHACYAGVRSSFRPNLVLARSLHPRSLAWRSLFVANLSSTVSERMPIAKEKVHATACCCRVAATTLAHNFIWPYSSSVLNRYRNPNLMTKARICKRLGQDRDPKVWESVRMNSHTHKWIPMLWVEVLMDFRIFRERLQGSKPLALKSFLYHWKAIEMKMSKMGSNDPFGHLKHNLWPKERPGVKLTVWFSTMKSRESTRFPCV
jgi:hypothetical protein